MGTTQNDGINISILAHQLIDTFLDEVISTRAIRFISFYDGSPQRTSHTIYLYVWPQLTYFHLVALTLDGTFRGKNTHMPALGEFANHLGSWSDNTQHATIRIQFRNIPLLDGTQGFSRCRIATQDNQMTTH